MAILAMPVHGQDARGTELQPAPSSYFSAFTSAFAG